MAVLTVLGPVDAAELGFTLPHEHLLFDLTVFLHEPDEEWKREYANKPVTMETTGAVRRDPTICRDNLILRDEDVAARELERFRQAGGGTIIDLTPPALGRDPAALRRLSERTGVRIVASTGHYIAATHPPEVAGQSEDDLAAWMIGEITSGIGSTGVRAGVIGEIGVSPGGPHPSEVRMLRAAAFAQAETGVAISIHNAIPAERQGMRVLRILSGAGADLDRVVMGHMTQSVPDISYHKAIADTGATLEFDRFGAEFYDGTQDRAVGQNYCETRDSDVVTEISVLTRQGYADRIMLSHDAGFKIQLHSYGGLGLSHIPLRVTRYLRVAGVSDTAIGQMTVGNPAQMFAMQPPKTRSST
jgi:phosphotriesterase-related protein